MYYTNTLYIHLVKPHFWADGIPSRIFPPNTQNNVFPITILFLCYTAIVCIGETVKSSVKSNIINTQYLCCIFTLLAKWLNQEGAIQNINIFTFFKLLITHVPAWKYFKKL